MKKLIIIFLVLPYLLLAQSSWWNSSLGGGTNIPYSYVATEYGVTADGVTDDTQAMLDVIAACRQTGGTIYLPYGIINISSTLVIDTNNVTIQGTGMSASYDNINMVTGTILKWTGSSGTATVLQIEPIQDVNHGYLIGVKIKDISIYGSGSAGYGITIKSIRTSIFKNLYIRNCLVAAFSTFCVTTLGEVKDVSMSLFENITIRQSAYPNCICFNIIGSSTANTCFNIFKNLTAFYGDGGGMFLGSSDNNLFENLVLLRIPASTGIGLEISGSNDSDANTARDNHFIQLSPGAGGVVAKGTISFTYPSHDNAIIFYDETNSPPNPTIETGATLTWSNGFTAQ